MICNYVMLSILGYYDMIVFDVDSKDPGLGMNSPPAVFLQQEMLDSVKTLLSESGK